MFPKKPTRRHKIILPLALVVVLVGYTVFSGWMIAAPRELTAKLVDLSGDRSALDPFPLGLTLQSELLKQDIRIENGTLTSSVRYDRGRQPYAATDTPVSSAGSMLSPAPGAQTEITSGFLPIISFPSQELEPEEGYILTTDRAKIYLSGYVFEESLNGHFCIESDMYLQSTEPDLSIGYYDENQLSYASRADKKDDGLGSYSIYGATIGPNRMDPDLFESFQIDLQGVRCGDSIFFMPCTDGSIERATQITTDSNDVTQYSQSAVGSPGSTSTSTIQLTGTCHLYQVVEADYFAVPFEGCTPDNITTFGKVEPVLSFPAEDCSLLTLQNIDDEYIFLGVKTGRELQFYLLRPDGTVQDQCSLPIPDDVSDGLTWESESQFANRDTDGAACQTLGLTASNVYYEDRNTVHIGVEFSEFLSFRITDHLELASHQDYEISTYPMLMAYRDGKLFVLDQVDRNFPLPTAVPDDSSYFYSPSYTQLYVSVYDDTGRLYYGELQTDINDQYFRSYYSRSYANFYLLDEPDTLQRGTSL